MANRTPPINSVGKFSVAAPFVTNAEATYTCEAVAGFEALIEEGVDVFGDYYIANGLTEADYVRDMSEGINIVTLMSDTEPTVHVPSSYILSFPLGDGIKYYRTVVAVDLGPLPKGTLLNTFIEEVKLLAKDFAGVEPEVNVCLGALTGVLNQDQHFTAEANRRSSIKYNRTTRRQLKEALEALNECRIRGELLQEIIEQENA